MCPAVLYVNTMSHVGQFLVYIPFSVGLYGALFFTRITHFVHSLLFWDDILNARIEVYVNNLLQFGQFLTQDFNKASLAILLDIILASREHLLQKVFFFVWDHRLL